MAFVLSLCDRTGVMVKPWLDAGYDCRIVDQQHPIGPLADGSLYGGCGTLYRIGADVRTLHPEEIAGVLIAFAFPPCTDLASSGARWFAEKGLEGLHEALGLVIACKQICEASGAPWMLENPVGTLASYWRPPDYVFDPWQYARYLADVKQDAYTKGNYILDSRSRSGP
jgi:hypothetical protein